MKFTWKTYLTAPLALAALAACGDSGGGGGGKTDAGGGGAESDLGVGAAGGSGGSGGTPVAGSGGEGGSGGTPVAGSGGQGGSGATGGMGGTGGVAGAGGTGGVVVDLGVTDMNVPTDGPAVDPDGSVDVLCTDCETDDDCHGGTCADFDGVRFCTLHCSVGVDCGLSYTCEAHDGIEGTICVPPLGVCNPVLPCADADGDGYGEGPGCLGPDCDDVDIDVHPGVADPCDGRNNNCNNETDEDFVRVACGDGACVALSDCVNGQPVACLPEPPTGDDTDCDNVDDNCNGVPDEAYVPVPCGFGVCAAVSSCAGGVETACQIGQATLPDDTNCNGVDEDCNGVNDEDYVGEPCGEGTCEIRGHCEDGGPVCTPLPQLSPDDATCNGEDDNCEGRVDEDFVTVLSCGNGACHREGACDPAVGEETCVPGQAAESDSTCDGVDDDCDGLVDEECGDNNMGFELVGIDVDSIDIAIIYRQTFSPGQDPADTQPRLLNFWFTYSDSLALFPDSNPDREGLDGTAEQGEALRVAQKGIRVVADPDRVNTLRFTAVSGGNTNRIAPDPDTGEAEIAILHFQLDGPAPFELHWIPVDPNGLVQGTTVSPDEAMATLSLTDGSFPP